MYRGLKISMIAGVFSKMVQVKVDIFNILLIKKKKPVKLSNLTFYIQWKFILKVK